MKPRRPWFVKAAGLLGWLAWSAVAATAGTAPDTIPPDQLEFFEKHVRPLLVKRCFECHGGTRTEGGLSLATANGWKRGRDSGPAIVPGQPEASLLVEAIEHRSLEMPPADRGGKIPAEEIAILTRWVEMGAPDPRSGDGVLGGMTADEARGWWAFQPLPSAPPLESHEIDALLERPGKRFPGSAAFPPEAAFFSCRRGVSPSPAAWRLRGALASSTAHRL